jgi:hypothetical protein
MISFLQVSVPDTTRYSAALQLLLSKVIMTVVGTIADKCKSPEYLKIEVTPEKLIFEWHQISD